jgi:hypothetical protein
MKLIEYNKSFLYTLFFTEYIMNKIPQDNVLKAETWGPKYWFFMMTLAISYPDSPNKVTKRKYYDFIHNIPLFIPDSEIGDRFSRLLDKYPVVPYLDNRESFIRWVHFIHNKVNYMLGKEEISFSAALENYLAEYRPKPVYLSDKIKLRKYWIFASFIMICAILIWYFWV